MIGNTKFIITHETLKAALQLYLDTVDFREGRSPIVVGIKEEKDRSSYSSGGFEVETKEREPEKPPEPEAPIPLAP